MYRISINLFNDYHKKIKTNNETILHKTYFDDLLGSINSDIDVNKLKQTKDIAIKLFNRLNIKEKAVVLADIEHKKFNKYLPDDVNQKLANDLGVKADTVRKIRERAITKLKKAIHDINAE
jgi:DNA-directed RNA polymerase specialized sigma24 family protein